MRAKPAAPKLPPATPEVAVPAAAAAAAAVPAAGPFATLPGRPIMELSAPEAATELLPPPAAVAPGAPMPVWAERREEKDPLPAAAAAPSSPLQPAKISEWLSAAW